MLLAPMSESKEQVKAACKTNMPEPPRIKPKTTLAGQRLQRACACDGSAMECKECKKKREGELLQRKAARAGTTNRAPAIVHDVLRSSGRPLEAPVRSFFEPNFRSNFAHVRIHTDEKAARSAQAVGALAYTVGRNVVFAQGQYRPGEKQSNALLAHELTHVIQQENAVGGSSSDLAISPCDSVQEREADAAAMAVTGNTNAPGAHLTSAPSSIQRACGPAAIGHPGGCTGVEGDILGDHFLFKVTCDELRKPPDSPTDETVRLRMFAATIPSGDALDIHGFASEEGDAAFNESLSCARAIEAQSVLSAEFARTGKTVTMRLFEHGATAGNREERRSVFIDWHPAAPTTTTTPPPPTGCTPAAGVPPTVCGAYAANSWWLPLAYVDNATCACSTTPGAPEYNCIRKFLQDRMASASPALKALAASKKGLESSLNPIDIAEYKKFVVDNLTPVIFKDHVDAYASCCCPSGPAPFPAWVGVTTVPLPTCSMVGESIRWFGSCHGTPGKF
ncbi:MAG TPA: DUF4157 domain-containing protein [Pseudacidobacterium sp.]|nr:DUF4157 domain-containing protein [Pseudacidobacterium sp.]